MLCCSYMDTEQYEEAVRDYEHVYQTEKTKGQNQDALFPPRRLRLLIPCSAFLFNLLILCCRTQTPPEKCPIGVEEKQEERLL